MRYVKTFKLFEEAGHYTFLEEFCEKVSDGGETMGTMNYKSDTPAVLFEVSIKELSFWKGISKKVSSRDTVHWIKDNIDDMMFGETEEETNSKIKQLNFYEVDPKVNDKRLEDYVNFAAKHGMAIDRWLFSEASKYSQLKFTDIEMLVRFRVDKELSHQHRGNIARRKFSPR